MTNEPLDLTGMLTCQEVVELVTTYHEHLLPPEEHQRFEAHLAICPPCRTYVAQIAQTVRMMGALTAEQESAEGTLVLLDLFRDWKRGRTLSDTD